MLLDRLGQAMAVHVVELHVEGLEQAQADADVLRKYLASLKRAIQNRLVYPAEARSGLRRRRADDPFHPHRER